MKDFFTAWALFALLLTLQPFLAAAFLYQNLPSTRHHHFRISSSAACPPSLVRLRSSSSDEGRWSISGRWEADNSGGEQFLLKEKFGKYFKVPNPATLMTRISDAFAKSAIIAAKETGAELIIAITRSGLTVHALAKFFSPVPIMVLSASSKVCSQVLLHRGVTPYLVGSLQRESCVPRAIAKATELRLVGAGSRVLLLTGDDGLAANKLETFVVGEGMQTESRHNDTTVFVAQDQL